MRILVADRSPVAIAVEDRLLGAVRLRAFPRQSDAAIAALATSEEEWADLVMPSLAILPDGRVVRWETGLVETAETELDSYRVIGRVTVGSEVSPLRHPDSPQYLTLADLLALGIVGRGEEPVSWRRPRIASVLGCTVTEVRSPNLSSAGPIVRSFMTFRLRMDDQGEAKLESCWHIPPAYALQAASVLPGLTLDAAFDWLATPLRQRFAADGRIHIRDGSLTFHCSSIPLVLPGPDCLRRPAAPAIADLAIGAYGLPGQLVAREGFLRFDVMGAPGFHIELMAAEGGRLRLLCGPEGRVEARDVFPTGMRKFLSDFSLYLECCDLSIEANNAEMPCLPWFGEWMTRRGSC